MAADPSSVSSLTQPQVEPGAPSSLRTYLHFSGLGASLPTSPPWRLLLDFLPQVPPHPLAYLPFVPPDSHTASPSLVPPCLTSKAAALLVLPGSEVFGFVYVLGSFVLETWATTWSLLSSWSYQQASTHASVSIKSSSLASQLYFG